MTLFVTFNRNCLCSSSTDISRETKKHCKNTINVTLNPQWFNVLHDLSIVQAMVSPYVAYIYFMLASCQETVVIVVMTFLCDLRTIVTTCSGKCMFVQCISTFPTLTALTLLNFKILMKKTVLWPFSGVKKTDFFVQRPLEWLMYSEKHHTCILSRC